MKLLVNLVNKNGSLLSLLHRYIDVWRAVNEPALISRCVSVCLLIMYSK